MARMLPALPIDTDSAAERGLFNRLRDELGPEWTVLHSLVLLNHRRKRRAEIDFVVVGPPGLFCLEVKGGRVRREAGVWYHTNRHGRTVTRREGPFDQVASAEAALRQWVLERRPDLRDVFAGYGILTPDTVLTADAPDWDPAIVHDRDSGPLPDYMTRLAAHWHGWLRDRGIDPPALDGHRVDEVAAVLRPDVDGSTAAAEATAVRGELDRLTLQQARALAGLRDNPRVLVRGGAGTGKTMLAVAEAHRAAGEGARVLLCCFNRLLAAHLRAGLEPDGAPFDVAHLHGWMMRVVRDSGEANGTPAAETDDLMEVVLPRACARVLARRGPRYDVLVVDELQDLLLDPYLDVWDRALEGGLSGGRWRMFLDPQQNIFDATAPAALARLEVAGPSRYRLETNCRNTRPTALTTALLSGTELTHALVDGPRTGMHWYGSAHEQADRVAEVATELLSHAEPEEIVLLSHRRLEQSGITGRLRSLPRPVVRLSDGCASPTRGSMSFATIAAYKGLEASHVLLLDVDDLHHLDALRRIYVGASRAQVGLDVFLDERVRGRHTALATEFGRRLAAIAS